MRRYFTVHPTTREAELVKAIKKSAHPLKDLHDLQPLFSRIGDAQIVMLGEGSHGTHEYYTWRAYITQKLIEEKGFNFVAVEGDWPDCYRLNRFVKGYDVDNKSAYSVLHAFNRWPTWMWANSETVALADWMKRHNAALSADKKVGFYGLDVYSLTESMESIMEYLRKADPSALPLAEMAFHCFQPYMKDEGRSYAEANRFVPKLCTEEVLKLLLEIQKRLPQYNSDHENVFNVEQNAVVTVNAETYYRAMLQGGPHCWNVRERHMYETMKRLMAFHGKDSKIIVWAHNTHVGDARATDMVTEGMYNLGEMARMHLEDKGVVLVGFGSYSGKVLAGRRWGAPMQVIDMPPARNESWEHLLHEAGAEDKLLLMDDFASNDAMMEQQIPQRAIGVVYNPKYEAYGNYVPSIIPLRYDAFIYLDKTTALHPLHMDADSVQIPETYPFGV
jgi:erythromycin esterase